MGTDIGGCRTFFDWNYWWLPDVFFLQLLVNAGWTIGGCRMFFSVLSHADGLPKPGIGIRPSPYKAYYKASLENKGARGLWPACFLKK